MHLQRFYPLLFAATVLSVASCVDNDYDLSDIDTTASFDVNDLTLPINIESVLLKTVIDIPDSSKIKDADGIFALVEEGDFQSSQIHVNDFTITSPRISPISKSMDLNAYTGSKSRKEGNVANYVAYYSLTEASTSFNTSASNIDASIVSIDAVKGTAVIGLSISIDGLDNLIRTFHFTDFKLLIPKGLTFSGLSSNAGNLDIDCYDPVTGLLDLSRHELDSNGNTLTLNLTLCGIEASPAGIVLTDGTISFQGECKVLSGKISISLSDINTNVSLPDLPQQASFTFTPSISDIHVFHFSGTVKYDITGINIDPVKITGLPDFLNQEGTEITISNPQIYLSLNNPLIEQGYNLAAQTGVSLTSHWSDATSRSFTLDDGQLIRATSAQNLFLLSPTMPDTYYGSYTNPTHVTFSQLSEVIKGNGIPNTIDIEVVEPKIPAQPVTDFALGTNLNQVVGSYTLYAPLALGEGSRITYTDSIDGWLIKDDGSIDEDLDMLSISKLKVKTEVTTQIPMRLYLHAWPICLVNGHPTIMQDIEATAQVDAMAQNQDITVTLEGDIRHLDGIFIKAETVSANNQALAPDMELQLKHIRASVTGNYTREL